jgi:Glycosyltransferase WbsX
MKRRTYAIYFPQFYSIPVNDQAWGKHFTDWLLVGQANFAGLWDRRAPEKGYYDGSSPGLHAQQENEAKGSGLAGFGLYHYWFYSQQELSAFEDSILSGNILNEENSWFLIWANESWSKRWVGNAELLIDLVRNPSLEMIRSHCQHLARCFAQPGYTKWRGRPLFVLYNLGYFDHPQNVVENYRGCLKALGVDAAFVQVVKNPADLKYSSFMDGSYLFEPRLFFNTIRKEGGWFFQTALGFFRTLFGPKLTDRLLVQADKLQIHGKPHTYDQFIRYFSSPDRQEWLKQLKGAYQNILCPAWNNAPRYGKRYTSLEPIPPERLLDQLITSAQASDLPILINAWNEWSEGAAIEPCAYYGTRYLDVIKKFADYDDESSS